MVPLIDQDGLRFDFLWGILYFLDNSFVFHTICFFVTNEGFGHWLFRDLLFSLCEHINRERRRKHRVLVDKFDQCLLMEIFHSIGLKDQRYLCTSFQSFAPRVKVGCEIIIVTGRAKDILLGIGVFRSFSGNRSDVDLVGDQKTGNIYMRMADIWKMRRAHLL
jgi:hypothetical protein